MTNRKPMTQSQITSAQKEGGLNAAQRAADNREDARQRREATGSVSDKVGRKR